MAQMSLRAEWKVKCQGWICLDWLHLNAPGASPPNASNWHCNKHPNRKEIDFASHPEFSSSDVCKLIWFQGYIKCIHINHQKRFTAKSPCLQLRKFLVFLVPLNPTWTHPKAEDIEQVGNPFEPFASIRYRPSKLENGEKKQVSHYCWWFKIRRSPVEVGSLSHDFQGFVNARWLFGISSINSTTIPTRMIHEGSRTVLQSGPKPVIKGSDDSTYRGQLSQSPIYKAIYRGPILITCRGPTW